MQSFKISIIKPKSKSNGNLSKNVSSDASFKERVELSTVTKLIESYDATCHLNLLCYVFY